MFVLQDGDTALLKASYHGHTLLVELLINRGADIHHKDNLVRQRESGQGYLSVGSSVY